MTFEGRGELRKMDKISGRFSYNWIGFPLKKWRYSVGRAKVHIDYN